MFNKETFGCMNVDIGGIKLNNISSHLTCPPYQGQNKSIIFDSHFESGNLMYVFEKDKVNDIEVYDLILQNDINTKGHNQWFFFNMENQKKNLKVKLNIINFIKNDSLHNYGLKLMIFSQKRYLKT